MWYIAIVIMLVISLYVAYRLTLVVDRRLSGLEEHYEGEALKRKVEESVEP